MSNDLTEEQRELAGMLRAILAERSDSTAIRSAVESETGWDAGLWTLLCEEIGTASLAIPEEFGGAGFSAAETEVTLEELGYALTPSPYLGSVAIAAQAVLASGDDDACARLLPEIASGEQIAALAWAAPDGRWDPSRAAASATESAPGEWMLSGQVPFVLEGAAAGILIVLARTPAGPRLFEVADASAVRRTATPAMDLTLRLATLDLDAAAARPLGEPDPAVLETVHAHALAAVAAVQAGTAARGLDMTVDYARQRVQFGRAIGSFQAVKHRLADMHVQAEIARTTARAAAAALAADAPDRLELAALAKATCSRALASIAAETIQLHGGIAITWEHDAHLIFKRGHALGQLFGTAAELRRRAEERVLAAR
ncbi:acyl-CoA dehydrogenase family protein [Microbacterium sp. YJN-G]|uniref:acyl-CoA dehydrogenase family protein n=1 Tax=Microbacterium sp. YJN-G TaxID=2763257 RepID=UPI001878E919|nr:acyl-CoA dehydrogenase family protein [Microbacterium sp. YJN-G]